MRFVERLTQRLMNGLHSTHQCHAADSLETIHHRSGELIPSRLIVGLGNPGSKYAFNRHNIGFQCLDRIAQVHGLQFSQRRFEASLALGEILGVKVALAKPLTYMNLSGRVVSRLMRWYRVSAAGLLVIYDDVDLPLGKVRLRQQGGAGGHRGMLSIIDSLGMQSFPRLRVGIGRPVGEEPRDYVLSDFTLEERAIIEEVYERVVAAVECLLSDGIEAAMNRYNLSP